MIHSGRPGTLVLVQYGGGLTLEIFLRSKWLLGLPDLENFLSILAFFNGKKYFLPKCLILLKNDFYAMLFLFFSMLGNWGGWVFESMENSILSFEGFPK